jgi:peptide-methionine (S)-S-oxide reductase
LSFRFNKRNGLVVAGLGLFALIAVLALDGRFAFVGQSQPQEAGVLPDGAAQATFGGGCFWCTEAVFQQLKGVHSVVSGYSGGHVKNPTYEEVCGKRTGHAEVVQVTYDPAVLSYDGLLEAFWKTHDPTTRDRQGNDVGPQYRSVIFYHSDAQKKAAELSKRKLDAAHFFANPIVTEIAPFTEFYRAENYHQNFYQNNPNQSYCRVLIRPKLEKLREILRGSLKDAP